MHSVNLVILSQCSKYIKCMMLVASIRSQKRLYPCHSVIHVILCRYFLLQNQSLIPWNSRIGPSPSTARARNNAMFLQMFVVHVPLVEHPKLKHIGIVFVPKYIYIYINVYMYIYTYIFLVNTYIYIHTYTVNNYNYKCLILIF